MDMPFVQISAQMQWKLWFLKLVMSLYFQQHLEINQALLDARCSNFMDNIFPKI